jgi:hypothetical protein
MPSFEIQFSIQYKELVLVFPPPTNKRTPTLASAYQRKNPESRILRKENKNNVYLPVPAGLSHIRTSQSQKGFVFVFATEDAADAWVKHSVLGELYPPPNPENAKKLKKSKEAFIDIAHWDYDRLTAKLAIDEEASRGDIVRSPSPSPSQRHITHVVDATASLTSNH